MTLEFAALDDLLLFLSVLHQLANFPVFRRQENVGVATLLRINRTSAEKRKRRPPVTVVGVNWPSASSLAPLSFLSRRPKDLRLFP
jgi:hypothetical protein